MTKFELQMLAVGITAEAVERYHLLLSAPQIFDAISAYEQKEIRRAELVKRFVDLITEPDDLNEVVDMTKKVTQDFDKIMQVLEADEQETALSIICEHLSASALYAIKRG